VDGDRLSMQGLAAGSFPGGVWLAEI
jgi:hypothetical protein